MRRAKTLWSITNYSSFPWRSLCRHPSSLRIKCLSKSPQLEDHIFRLATSHSHWIDPPPLDFAILNSIAFSRNDTTTQWLVSFRLFFLVTHILLKLCSTYLRVESWLEVAGCSYTRCLIQFLYHIYLLFIRKFEYRVIGTLLIEKYRALFFLFDDC